MNPTSHEHSHLLQNMCEREGTGAGWVSRQKERIRSLVRMVGGIDSKKDESKDISPQNLLTRSLDPIPENATVTTQLIHPIDTIKFIAGENLNKV